MSLRSQHHTVSIYMLFHVVVVLDLHLQFELALLIDPILCGYGFDLS